MNPFHKPNNPEKAQNHLAVLNNAHSISAYKQKRLLKLLEDYYWNIDVEGSPAITDQKWSRIERVLASCKSKK